ncbi:SRPBCC family protein [Kineosporia sp. J2-2]|uniref:SRPBCC family protein n=1 Tax=Kineosporia corallincola TaxID=2835133 RepID=A0ABS5THW9_9ACTN|nr:SRPBCC family protein [Kineosporia corallincola]MBT0770692.1 SRPBCC family protein [Kineosporia corallincola]
MAIDSRHISVRIKRPAEPVYTFVADPTHLPDWAPGLCDRVEQVDGEWVASSPMGRAVLKFAPHNEFGVVDHHVTVPGGETFYNPMRVLADGPECEVVFTLRRLEGVTDDAFERDAEAVSADLARLKSLMES